LSNLPLPSSPLLSLFPPLLTLFAGCAFVESATELTYGEGTLPHIEQTSPLSSDLINSALFTLGPNLEQFLPSDAGIELPDLNSLELPLQATWQDVRGVICEAHALGWLDEPAIAVSLAPELSGIDNIERVMLAIGVFSNDDIEADEACLDGRVKWRWEVDFIPFTESQAQTIRDNLGSSLGDLKDAIVQLRFAFDRLGFQVVNDGETTNANHLLSDFQLILSDPRISDQEDTPYHDGEFTLIPHFLLNTIEPGSPQRFELDPDSPVTESVKRALLDWEDIKPLRIISEGTLDSEMLGTIPLAGTQVTIALQPEVTFSILMAVESLI